MTKKDEHGVGEESTKTEESVQASDEKWEQLLALNEMKRVLRPGGMAFLDLVNGELGAIKQNLAARGTGWQKKVAGGMIDGTQHHCFFHDRESLKALCSLSEFDSYKIKFINK